FIELAGSYWYCIYAWWRSCGFAAEAAGSATRGCLEQWTGGTPPRLEDEGSACMRDWLTARLCEIRETPPQPAGESPVAIDVEWAEAQFSLEPVAEPRALFERRWAL